MKKEDKNQVGYQKDLERRSTKVKGVQKYSDILSSVLHEGAEVFKLKNRTMFRSAIIAGLEIGFSYLLVCSLHYLLTGRVGEDTIFRLFSVVYPVGFVLVILGKGALYTEQTSVLALPVLNGQRSVWELLRVWGVVITGNIIGGMIFTFFISGLAPQMDLFTHQTMAIVGEHVLGYRWWVLLLSGVTAGWLMGLLTWLLNSTVNSLTRVLLIFIITGVIGFGGFHHSIVGNIEVFGALVHSAHVSIGNYLWFLLLTLLGNGIGGAVVVGLFKYRVFQSHFSE